MERKAFSRPDSAFISIVCISPRRTMAYLFSFYIAWSASRALRQRRSSCYSADPGAVVTKIEALYTDNRKPAREMFSRAGFSFAYVSANF